MNFYKDFKKQNKIIFTSAPLDGVSDLAFCKICLDGGADIVFTEMKSANDLYYESKNLIEELKGFSGLKNVVLQLYGKDPDKFKKAAKIGEDLGFCGIDINFGCPAKGVTSSGGGVMHMRDLDNIYKIVENTINGTRLPVSIKIRAGISIDSIKKHQLKVSDNTLDFIENKNFITALDLLKKVKNLNISCVIIHGRTYENLFSGEVDYELIKRCKDFINKEFNSNSFLIVNGGIFDVETANNIINRINPNGLMIGRGSYGKPFIFNEIKESINLNSKYFDINKKNFILNHAKYLMLSKPNKWHLDFRKHLIWYLKDEKYFLQLREKIVKIETINDLELILKDI